MKSPSTRDPQVDAVERQLLRDAFEPTAYYEQIKRNFLPLYDDRLGSETLDWLRSPVSQKTRKLEDWICTPEGVRETSMFAANPAMYRPSARRVDLIRQYLNASRTIEFTMDTMREFSYATHPVFVTPPPSKAEMDKNMAMLKPKMEQMLTIVFAVRYTYAFRSLTDGEIEECIRFNQSEPGRWFYRAFLKAYLATTLDRMHTLAVNFRAAILPLRGSMRK